MQARQPRVPASLMVNKYVDGTPFVSVVKDISASGILLFTPIEPFHQSQANVVLEFSISGAGGTVWVDARLSRYADDGLQAFEFTDLKPSVKNHLHAFVNDELGRIRTVEPCFNG